MTRRAWGSARDAVAAYAQAHPDARPCDIASALDLLPEYVSAAMRRLKLPGQTRQSRKLLHAAAPDLLSALIACKHGAEYCDELGDIIDAAIAKASSPAPHAGEQS